MSTGMMLLMGLLMGAVLLVMVLGIANLLRTDENAGKRSNKLMMWRVALQGLVLLVLGAMFALK